MSLPVFGYSPMATNFGRQAGDSYYMLDANPDASGSIIAGNLEVKGATQLDKTLDVKGTVTAEAGIDITGNISGNLGLQMNGSTILLGPAGTGSIYYDQTNTITALNGGSNNVVIASGATPDLVTLNGTAHTLTSSVPIVAPNFSSATSARKGGSFYSQVEYFSAGGGTPVAPITGTVTSNQPWAVIPASYISAINTALAPVAGGGAGNTNVLVDWNISLTFSGYTMNGSTGNGFLQGEVCLADGTSQNQVLIPLLVERAGVPNTDQVTFSWNFKYAANILATAQDLQFRPYFSPSSGGDATEILPGEIAYGRSFVSFTPIDAGLIGHYP